MIGSSRGWRRYWQISGSHWGSILKDWARIKKQQERDRQQADRSIDRYVRGASTRVTVKAAAEAVMEKVYTKASGNGRYPANARQIMCAARPAIQEQTEKALRDVYFTQTLLPDYIRDYAMFEQGIRCHTAAFRSWSASRGGLSPLMTSACPGQSGGRRTMSVASSASGRHRRGTRYLRNAGFPKAVTI